MLLSAGVMFYRQRDRPKEAEDPPLLRGGNIPAVTWVNKGGGSRDRGVRVLMRLLGRLRVVSGWSYLERHVAGGDYVTADGVLR